MSAGPARRWQWIGLCVGLGLLAFVTADLRLRTLAGVDRAAYDLVTPWHERGWPVHTVAETLSLPASIPWTLAITLLAATAWWQRGARRAAVCGVAGGLAASAAVTLLKLLVDREPPPFGIAHGDSFPSGHTAGAAMNLGLLILLEAQVLIDRHGWQGAQAARAWRCAIAAWASTALGTAAARLLAQAHWASDTLAALALGLALTCATLLAARVPRPPPAHA